jgi:hypothetical protein
MHISSNVTSVTSHRRRASNGMTIQGTIHHEHSRSTLFFLLALPASGETVIAFCVRYLGSHILRCNNGVAPFLPDSIFFRRYKAYACFERFLLLGRLPEFCSSNTLTIDLGYLFHFYTSRFVVHCLGV